MEFCDFQIILNKYQKYNSYDSIKYLIKLKIILLIPQKKH